MELVRMIWCLAGNEKTALRLAEVLQYWLKLTLSQAS
jgi:hypothetical protein